eukprot:CAMPEP_0176343140 /NCGR_PEP_ID=MMETSP0126-20121128/3711_1 /TAXON_ID=141414 ORGANISM="Strombidinopsis acuminatum, Strain SPMC142" /NCGR_SAMPLE_ID=MMETSP0126 /ASSEMBLY_ACC=CAM_ASM_000229 /LENGTH=163 /DNA_ID=CAMNT_0017688921 /DNA_START=1320 /DNA_END=1810 /DNA_ORIENTATION=+
MTSVVMFTTKLNPVNNALVVNGDHVTAYGLAGEHTLEHIVDWHGDYGATYFYQAELLYDNDWTWKNGDYVGYNVDESVNNHLGYGVSVYSYLRDLDVTASSAIKAPEKSGVYFKTASAIFMNGNGGFDHVINQSGAAANTNDRLSYQCSWNGQENATPEFFLQ